MSFNKRKDNQFDPYNVSSAKRKNNQCHNPKDIKFSSKREARSRNGNKPFSTPNSSFSSASNNTLNISSLDTYAPRGINVYEFAESRAYEIKNLKNALSEAKNNQNMRVFQQLPRHLRRRAASHDVRRVPKRVREEAKKEMDEPKPNKPSRKYKRRPRNLLEEYSRRSRNKKWLETHIWHAKRFKMVEKWGYKIAEQPSDKSFRACYRASVKSCLIQDQSYMEVIEIIGDDKTIVCGLKRMVGIEDNRFYEEMIFSGEKYNEVMLYQHDLFPLKAIGPVKYLWVHDYIDENKKKIIFIVHPVVSNEIVEEFKLIFNLHQDNDVELDEPINEDEKRDITKEEEQDQFECEVKQTNKSEEWPNETADVINTQLDVSSACTPIPNDMRVGATDEIKVNLQTSSTDPLVLPNNKIEESKPKAQRVNRVEPKQFRGEKIVLNCYELDFVMFSLVGALSHSILQNVLKTVTKETPKSTETDCKTFTYKDKLISFEEFGKLEKGVLNVCVEDPRLNLPHKKCNPFHNVTHVSDNYLNNQDKNAKCLSELWDSTTRNKFKEIKISDNEINKLRSSKLLPASELPIKKSVIPAVILQKPSHSPGNCEYGSGFDVLLPIGWAMPFWVAFIYQGARAGGMRENRNMDLESFCMTFPEHFVDTQASKDESQAVTAAKENKHLRYPPDKRRNYDILGIQNPFSTPWHDLVKDWKRNIVNLLSKIGDSNCNNEDISCVTDLYVLRNKTLLMQLRDFMNETSADNEVLKNMLIHQNSLVPVKIVSSYRSSPEDNARLYIPHDEDLESLKKNQGEEYPEEKYFGPLEPKHKGRIHEFPFVCKQHGILRHNALFTGTNTRWVVGYLTSGRYLFQIGKGGGVGYISMAALLYFFSVSKNRKTLLFRNIDTLQYRFCELDILGV